MPHLLYYPIYKETKRCSNRCYTATVRGPNFYVPKVALGSKNLAPQPKPPAGEQDFCFPRTRVPRESPKPVSDAPRDLDSPTELPASPGHLCLDARPAREPAARAAVFRAIFQRFFCSEKDPEKISLDNPPAAGVNVKQWCSGYGRWRYAPRAATSQNITRVACFLVHLS